ncbi:TauD/TfdA family dioxygenase [Hymenobacter sp. BT635]|uniref:TauD/TfdA family dioxygenase n=1 Tax=Hymenobacter nitidus TaxID=2880929 RepID=A0ABS8AJC7_9BACT|nr:TauD/TfdA family dioxygenase [Hymenobacter nitidus]MCB2380548.1 TauD/TfdA family dioxygenase [Hymenobacter nitidus]
MNNLAKLKAAKAAPMLAELDQDITVKEYFAGTGSLPLVIKPLMKGVDLKTWIEEHRAEVEADLVQHGGILFRGFAINTVEKFDTFMKCFSEESIPYMFRSSPRYAVADRVYVSTTYPNERTINMHSESSYSYAWGRKIIFCCIKAAEEQGETPIADNRRVLASLSPALRQKFMDLGVIYQRNLSPHIGMPWQEVFQTTDPEEVKRVCAENNVQCIFSGKDNLTIRWQKPAIYAHPDSGDLMWFNHSYFFNKYSLYEEIGLEPEDEMPEELLPSNTFFGDGSEISFEEYSEIKNAYDKEKVLFLWQEGDLLLLDNMMTAHGRSPYKGERQIVVSIVEPYKKPTATNN